MFSDLKPYTDYSSSGIKWVPTLPTGWQRRRGKALFRKMDRPVRGDDQIVTCFRDGVVTLRANRRTRGFTEALQEIGYQGVRRGDLVIHAMDSFSGAVGVSDSDGKVTPVYSVCAPRADADPGYYGLVVREMASRGWILSLARGVRERSTDFRFEAFGAQFLPTPSLSEQEAIVKFLGHANARIDRAIAAKRKMIALLEEQRRAILDTAVTGGLGAVDRQKELGIPWLPRIPESWTTARLGALIADGPRNGVSPAEHEEGTLESLSISVIRGGRVDVRSGDLKYLRSDSVSNMERYSLRRNDILLVRGNGNPRFVGAVGLVSEDMSGRIYPDLLMRIRVNSRVLPEFLVSALTCRSSRIQIELAAKTTVGTFKVNNWQVRQLVVALPTLLEQKAIVRRIEEDSRPLSEAKARAVREIALLHEFRTRLTSDAVTGQLDVRDAAAKLPDLDPSDLSTADIEDPEDIDAVAEEFLDEDEP